jgi:colanic acid biosynthesis glycosyl transferase WcaI
MSRPNVHQIDFAVDLTGIGKFSGDMAAWLAEQGHDVRVVAARSYLSSEVRK